MTGLGLVDEVVSGSLTVGATISALLLAKSSRGVVAASDCIDQGHSQFSQRLSGREQLASEQP